MFPNKQPKVINNDAFFSYVELLLCIYAL